MRGRETIERERERRERQKERFYSGYALYLEYMLPLSKCYKVNAKDRYYVTSEFKKTVIDDEILIQDLNERKK